MIVIISLTFITLHLIVNMKYKKIKNSLVNQKAVYIHIPKTGGSSVRHLFPNFNGIIDHITTEELLQLYPEMKHKYLFAFVRNPWDRMVSLYHFIQTLKFNERKGWVTLPWILTYLYKYPRMFNNVYTHFYYIKLTKKYENFTDFVKDIHNNLEWCMLKPQYDYLYSKEDKLLVNYVGKFENIQKELDKVTDVININREILPKVNATEHVHYSQYYNEETKEIISKIYRKDIEKFNYKFEDQDKTKQDKDIISKLENTENKGDKEEIAIC